MTTAVAKGRLDGFLSLLNGKDLNGWFADGLDRGNWIVSGKHGHALQGTLDTVKWLLSTAGNPSVEMVLVTGQYTNCRNQARGVGDEAFALGLCCAAGMKWRRVAFYHLSGIHAIGRGRDAREDAENQEVRLVGSEDQLDSGLPIRCGKARIQQSLSAQRELLQPREKLPHGTSVGERLHDVA